MTKRATARLSSETSEFLPILDDLIATFCVRLRSSKKGITIGDLTKLLEVRTKMGGPVSQKSELWHLIEQIRQEKESSPAAKLEKGVESAKPTKRGSNVQES